jgi:hypothetical protein
MGLVLLASLLLVAEVPLETPVLCVEARGDPPIDAKELIAAIRARIAREEVVVERCGARPTSTWRIIATFKKKDEAELALEGRDIDAKRTLYIGGLGRQEISQTIALTAVEVVRRPLDALLASLGLAPPPPIEDRCPEPPPPTPCPTCAEPRVCAEPPPCPEKVCPTCEVCAACAECPPPIEVPATAHFGVGLDLGPTFSSAGIGSFVALSAPLRYGPLAIVPHVGVDPLGQIGDSPRGFDLELGLLGALAIDPLELGVGVASRLHLLTVSGTANADGTTSVWASGFLLAAGVDFLELGPATIGLAARAWIWPEPPRFRVDGVIASEEPHFEVGVFPRITLRLF